MPDAGAYAEGFDLGHPDVPIGPSDALVIATQGRADRKALESAAGEFGCRIHCFCGQPPQGRKPWQSGVQAEAAAMRPQASPASKRRRVWT